MTSLIEASQSQASKSLHSFPLITKVLSLPNDQDPVIPPLKVPLLLNTISIDVGDSKTIAKHHYHVDIPAIPVASPLYSLKSVEQSEWQMRIGESIRNTLHH